LSAYAYSVRGHARGGLAVASCRLAVRGTAGDRPAAGGSSAADPPVAAPLHAPAVGAGPHHRNQPPAWPRTRLTSRNHPYDQEETQQGPWNPAHQARQPTLQARPDVENSSHPVLQAT
jgi:hypothetical protein